jgi:tocopherol O-methyltransferase
VPHTNRRGWLGETKRRGKSRHCYGKRNWATLVRGYPLADNTFEREEIARYYDRTGFDYAVVWQSPFAGSLHFGFWTPRVRTLKGALIEQTRTMARAAKVGEDSRVLDAGCGIGGPAMVLAQEYGAVVTGVTIAARQVTTARRRASRKDLLGKVDFALVDYTDTPYADETFDVVWAIESVCHADDKGAFLKEAARLLRPGGRLVIADGFAADRTLTKAEADVMRSWLDGWRVPHLLSLESFSEAAQQAGLQTLSSQDVTDLVMPSSRRLYASSVALGGFHRAGQLLGLRGEEHAGNIAAARDQYLALRAGMWQYGLFLAEKPAS